MKIISLEAENFKRLKAVQITPDGNVVMITGANAQGKTSVIDSIWVALKGLDAAPAVPVRRGAESARIRLDMGELIVTRKFTKSGSTLTVESAEGARFRSPQAVLDGITGALSFNPLAFTRMKPREQYDELRRIVKLDIDIDALDGKNASAFERRTDLNRTAKQRRATAEAIVVAPDLPDDLIDVKALLDSIQGAAEKNDITTTRQRNREKAARDAEEAEARVEQWKETVVGLMRQIADAERIQGEQEEKAKALRQALAQAPPLPALIDVTDLRAQLDTASTVNKDIEARERRRTIEAEAIALEAQAATLTSDIEAREREKADAIASAAMPVPGLGFGEGIVLFNGIPFDQASSAEQMTVSLRIAMAANPKVRVIRIEGGERLDRASLEQIEAMAEAEDYQVWMEKMDESGKVGIVIEDGEVAAVDGKASAKKDTVPA